MIWCQILVNAFETGLLRGSRVWRSGGNSIWRFSHISTDTDCVVVREIKRGFRPGHVCVAFGLILKGGELGTSKMHAGNGNMLKVVCLYLRFAHAYIQC